MADIEKHLLVKGGSSEKCTQFTGKNRELIVDTGASGQGPYTLRVMDGSTPGGYVVGGAAASSINIYKTYPTITQMQTDVANVPMGKFVIIAGSNTDAENGRIYVKTTTGFVYITKLGSTTGLDASYGVTAAQYANMKANIEYIATQLRVTLPHAM